MEFTTNINDPALKPATRRALQEALNTLMYFIDDSNVSGSGLTAAAIKTGVLRSTDGKTYFDLDNGQIVINDGTNDRVLIGKF